MNNFDKSIDFTPVIVIGAGRSGTNALRDMLCSLPSVATWPCDEINPIWRHGNLLFPHDAIPASRATTPIRRFIRGQFLKQWLRSGKPDFLVEKTCANSLRVPFVRRVFPEARFIHLVRSGNQVISSAKKRWCGDMEFDLLPYLSAKARFTPWRDIPYYSWRFANSRISRIVSGKKMLSSWGPRFEGMDDYSALNIENICAAQWAKCVLSAYDAFSALPASVVLSINYAELTDDPANTLQSIKDFLGITASSDETARATAMIWSFVKKPAEELDLSPKEQALSDRANLLITNNISN